MTCRELDCPKAGIEHGHDAGQVPARPFIRGPSIPSAMLRVHRETQFAIDSIMATMMIPGDGR